MFMYMSLPTPAFSSKIKHLCILVDWEEQGRILLNQVLNESRVWRMWQCGQFQTADFMLSFLSDRTLQ
jgi:hypothetical protein